MFNPQSNKKSKKPSWALPADSSKDDDSSEFGTALSESPGEFKTVEPLKDHDGPSKVEDKKSGEVEAESIASEKVDKEDKEADDDVPDFKPTGDKDDGSSDDDGGGGGGGGPDRGGNPSAQIPKKSWSREIRDAVMNEGIVPVITKVYFMPGWSYKCFLGQNELESKLGTLMTYSMLSWRGMPLLDKTPLSPDQALDNIDPTVKTQILDAGKRWYIDLVACHQVSRLTDSNITNYFASKGSDVTPWKIEEILNYLASMDDNLVRIPEIKLMIDASQFVLYHTTACATPCLIERAFGSMGMTVEQVFGDAADRVYRAARSDITDIKLARLIPSKVLVATSAMLESSGSLPNNWYMGQKAVALFSPSAYRCQVQLFARITALRYDLATITTETDLAVLHARVVSSFN